MNNIYHKFSVPISLEKEQSYYLGYSNSGCTLLKPVYKTVRKQYRGIRRLLCLLMFIDTWYEAQEIDKLEVIGKTSTSSAVGEEPNIQEVVLDCLKPNSEHPKRLRIEFL